MEKKYAIAYRDHGGAWVTRVIGVVFIDGVATPTGEEFVCTDDARDAGYEVLYR